MDDDALDALMWEYAASIENECLQLDTCGPDVHDVRCPLARPEKYFL